MSSREGGSHIRDDGYAKVCYLTEEHAVIVANRLWATLNRPHAAYLCSQGPQHWHVGNGVNDMPDSIVTRNRRIR